MTLLALLACAPAPSGPPNIVLVSIDTLRADRLAAGGGTAGLTPNLDAFAAESTVFSNAYSQATLTGPSHASLFTSRYPSEMAGTTHAPLFSREMYTLPEVLAIYGYQTAAFVAGGDLAVAVGPRRGFATYQASVDFGSFFHTIPMAAAWLDQADTTKPFFLFVHGYDAHPTYLKPTPWGLLFAGGARLSQDQLSTLNATEQVIEGRRHPSLALLDALNRQVLRPWSPSGRAALARLVADSARTAPEVSAEDQQLIRDVYDGAVAYADMQFGLLMARLEARGRLDDTLVVVLSDHGEVLGEEGLFHRCCTLNDEATHVPLMLRLPGGRQGGRRVEGIVELVDLYPTLVELAGAVPAAGIRGASFAAAVRGEPFAGRAEALSQGGLGLRMASMRSGAGRLTYTGIRAIPGVLNDLLATAQVPGPAFGASDGLALDEQRRLRTALAAWQTSLAEPEEKTRQAIPDALRDTLRARGYWDAQ